MPTLTERITNAYNLMLNGETAAEQTYANRMNALLERIPRPARF